MKDKKLVMVGCHEVGYPIVKALLEEGFKFSYFVTISQELAKKEKVSGFFSFEALAQEYNVPVYYAEKYSLKSESDIIFFKKNNFDLLIQGGWQRLFPSEVLESLKIGAIGVHGSPEFLPKGRGRSPLNWSLINGNNRFIMHFFLLKSGIDDGDVFHYEMFDINLWDDIRTLYYKNSYITLRTLKRFIPLLLGGKTTCFPQVGEPTYYPKRTEDDGEINWNKPVVDIYNFIRALTHPYPGAYSYINGSKIKIWKAQPFDFHLDTPEQQIGEIVEVFAKNAIVVKCISGLLLITELKGEIEIKKGCKFERSMQ